jgi:DHA2 family multidrug resistance protein
MSDVATLQPVPDGLAPADLLTRRSAGAALDLQRQRLRPVDIRPPLAGPLSGGGALPINPWFVALTVTLATFMELLDTSIANVALPHIAGGTSSSADEATWVLSSYLVANAVVLPLSAWLSRVFGRKRYYMISVGLFVVSSLLCGLAPSLGWLIFFRVLQGVGGGGLAPCEQAILVDTFPASRRATAFAVYSFAVVAAPAIGPTLGGWITDNFSWRWVFFINIPIGLVSLLLTSQLVSDPPAFTAERKALAARGKLQIDYIGILLVAIGFGCLEVVLDKGQEDDWFGSQFICIFATIAALSLIAAVFWELRVKDPVVELSLLKDRNFAIASIFYFSFGVVLFGSTVLMPEMLQGLFGYSATDAGMVMTPGALVIMAMIPIVVRLLRITGPRLLIAVGLIGTALTLWNLVHFDLSTDYGSFIGARVLQGFALSFLFVPTSTLAYSNLPKNKNNKASSLTNLFRNLGGSVGISFVTTLLARRSQFHQNRLAEHVSCNGVTTAALHHVTTALTSHLGAVGATHAAWAMIYARAQHQASMLAFLDGYWVLGAIALIPVVLTLFISKVRPALSLPNGTNASAAEGAH